MPSVRIHVDGGFAVGASSFNRKGSPRSRNYIVERPIDEEMTAEYDWLHVSATPLASTLAANKAGRNAGIEKSPARAGLRLGYEHLLL